VHFQLLTAHFTEHFFLPIQFIEGVWFKHDAFLVVAVVKPEQVPDFVRTFFCYPINEVIIVPFPPVILITQPGSRNHRRTDRLAGKPEHKTVTIVKKILVNHKEEGIFYGMAVFVRLDTV
jgi:hypothetical protein